VLSRLKGAVSGLFLGIFYNVLPLGHKTTRGLSIENNLCVLSPKSDRKDHNMRLLRILIQSIRK
jgi:hypothetical protein